MEGMAAGVPPDIQALADQFNAAERDAGTLVAGLSEEQGAWQAEVSSWTVAQCLDHLAITNRAYLSAMREPAVQGMEQQRQRRGPARPGWAGRWFVSALEPPVKMRIRAPKIVVPRRAPALADSFSSFTASQHEVRAFLHMYADLDLAGIRLPNPFARGVRFSLATALHAIAAHERRHLWQAWGVRRAWEQGAGK